jgi:hypothetical protein
MQEREPRRDFESALDELLARSDRAAHAWIAERLVARDEIDPVEAPAVGEAAAEDGDTVLAAG